MSIPAYIALGLGAAMAWTSARAETSADADTLRSSLTEMLSLVSLGTVSIADGPAQVTKSGADVRIQLPLNGFVAPPGASIEALAHPSPGGVWDVTSLTVPPAGALGTSIDKVVSYTVARQAMHGRLDPKLLTPSTFMADLGAITLQTASGDQSSNQAIERVTLDGTISGAPDSRVDLAAHDTASNWHLVVRDPAGPVADNFARQVGGQVSLTGLDRAQGRRLIAAARSLAGTAKSAAAQPDLTPAMRDGLREILAATEGLLTRLKRTRPWTA